MDRPIITLFMLMSVDGKISTGSTEELDVDRDFPTIPGLKEGLHQYYEIEQTTDLWSFNTGRVQAKVGVNEKELPDKTPVSFVILDNHHLTEHGVRYFCALSDQFVIIILIITFTWTLIFIAYDYRVLDAELFYSKAGIGAGTPQQVPLCSNCYSVICNSKVKLALEMQYGL